MVATEVRAGVRVERAPVGPVRVAVAAWFALVAAAVGWGAVIGPHHRLWLGSLPPLSGAVGLRAGPGLLLAGLVAAGLVAALPALARLPWRAALWAGGAAAAAWSVSLASNEGLGRLTAPLTSRYDYRGAALTAATVDLLGFVRTFVDVLPSYSVHVTGHPPGPVLVAAALHGVGLRGPGWQAALAIGAGSSAVAAVAVTLRAVAGEATARRALPFLVVAPYAVWVATSMDALFLGMSAWGVAGLAVAARSRRDGPAMAGGLLLGAGLYLSYGLAPLGLVAVAVVVVHRRVRPLLVGTVGVLVVVAAFSAAGFWWPAGVAATHTAWASGIGPLRPAGYFLVGNLAVLAVMTGPAAAAASTGLRRGDLAWVVAAALLAVLASDLSPYERGEVERIWLPYAPWVLAATGIGLPSRQLRWWLGASAVLALLVQAWVRSPW